MVVRWSHRCPWKAIAQVFWDLCPYIHLVVGNGERIHFEKISGGVTNLYAHNSLVFIELFL